MNQPSTYCVQYDNYYRSYDGDNGSNRPHSDLCRSSVASYRRDYQLFNNPQSPLKSSSDGKESDLSGITSSINQSKPVSEEDILAYVSPAAETSETENCDAEEEVEDLEYNCFLEQPPLVTVQNYKILANQKRDSLPPGKSRNEAPCFETDTQPIIDMVAIEIQEISLLVDGGELEKHSIKPSVHSSMNQEDYKEKKFSSMVEQESLVSTDGRLGKLLQSDKERSILPFLPERKVAFPTPLPEEGHVVPVIPHFTTNVTKLPSVIEVSNDSECVRSSTQNRKGKITMRLQIGRDNSLIDRAYTFLASGASESSFFKFKFRNAPCTLLRRNSWRTTKFEKHHTNLSFLSFHR